MLWLVASLFTPSPGLHQNTSPIKTRLVHTVLFTVESQMPTYIKCSEVAYQVKKILPLISWMGREVMGDSWTSSLGSSGPVRTRLQKAHRAPQQRREAAERSSGEKFGDLANSGPNLGLSFGLIPLRTTVVPAWGASFHVYVCVAHVCIYASMCEGAHVCLYILCACM